MLRAGPSSPPYLQTPASAVLVLLASRRVLCALYPNIKYQIKVSYRYNILCYLYNVCACDQQYYYTHSLCSLHQNKNLWSKVLFICWSCDLEQTST